jgi:hypothetical protein
MEEMEVQVDTVVEEEMEESKINFKKIVVESKKINK